MAVNAKSVYLTSHLILPIMEKQEGGGVVVNISSIAAMRYLGDATTAYATAKGAVGAFTRVVAAEYAGRGVRVNAVVPGLMDTPLVKGMGADYEVVRK
jgi:NAD(P)-dependent dehydrogenase (short-subunit alcohol dehydrogenase family)